MISRKKRTRLTASAGALALLAAGLLSSPASADVPAGNIDPAGEGTLTVHKHENDSPGGPGNGSEITEAEDLDELGQAVNGVEFTVQEVLFKGASVPLATAEGWTAIEDLVPGDLPGGDFTLGSGTSQSTEAGVAEFNLGVGLYLVTETASGDNLIKTPAAPFLVTIPFPNDDGTWNYDVHVYPKNELQTIEPTKEVSGHTGTEVPGALVEWTITIPVPASALDYESLVIEDALAPGLDFEEWSSITIGTSVLDPETHYTVSADGSTVELTPAGLAVLNSQRAAGTTVTAVLLTEVNGTGVGVLENSADITINGKTVPTGEPTTNWGILTVQKVSDDEETPLDGAEFEVYASDKSTLIGEAKSTEDGEVSWHLFIGDDDVKTRTVWVKETAAPAGHVLPADPWFGPYVLDAEADGATVTYTVVNSKPEGPDLPLTGAQGTILFSVIGLGLIGAGAVAIGIRRSRANH